MFHIESSLRGVLLQPWKWQLISSLFPPDVAQLDGRGYEDRIRFNQSHFHPWRKIRIALRGDLVYAFAGRMYPWKPGMVFFHDAYEMHENLAGGFGCGEADLLDIVFADTHVEAYLITLKAGRMSRLIAWDNVFDINRLGIDVARHWSIVALRPDLGQNIARMRLLSATSLLVTVLLDRQVVSHTTEGSELSTLDHICSRLRETGGAWVDVESLAQTSGYSCQHFRRIFRKHTGTSLHRYIDMCRAQRLEQLLAQGLSHKEISALLGFAHPSAFSRWNRIQREKAQKKTYPEIFTEDGIR